MHFVHTRAARPRVDLKRRMELILWVLDEDQDLALILWFVEWDPSFLSLANPLPPLAIHPIVACRALRAVPHIAGRVGGKEK